MNRYKIRMDSIEDFSFGFVCGNINALGGTSLNLKVEGNIVDGLYGKLTAIMSEDSMEELKRLLSKGRFNVEIERENSHE